MIKSNIHFNQLWKKSFFFVAYNGNFKYSYVSFSNRHYGLGTVKYSCYCVKWWFWHHVLTSEIAHNTRSAATPLSTIILAKKTQELENIFLFLSHWQTDIHIRPTLLLSFRHFLTILDVIQAASGFFPAFCSIIWVMYNYRTTEEDKSYT